MKLKSVQPHIGLVLLLLLVCASARGTMPAPEKLLPENSLLMLTTPDFGKLKEIVANSPQSRLWNDPAMKPFRDKFLEKWNDEFRKPLERELEIDFDDYDSLLQGQVTFALVPNGRAESEERSVSKLLLIDTRERSDQLKTNLANLWTKWIDAGKAIKIESIRGFQFSVVTVTSNDVPRTLQKIFPPSPPVQELGADTENTKIERSELVLGQVESVLIIGSSVDVVEKIVTQMTGGAIPTLGDLSAYDSSHQSMFREAPLYGWLNVKAYTQRKAAVHSDGREPDPFGTITLDRLMKAFGLSSVQTVAFNFRPSNEGSLFQVFLGAPETARQGLLKIFNSQSKDTKPPPFIPADVTKFQRWRIDVKAAWVAFGRMLGELSPQWVGGLDLLLEAANKAAKEKDPGFDLKRYLVGNLGDDIVRYEKEKRAGSPTGSSGAQLLLVGSPNPDQLAAAWKTFLVFLNQGATPTERDFLGHKLFSLPMPNLGIPLGAFGAKPALPRTLHCGASGGYLAMSTDVAVLEEYMRSSESDSRSLREMPGLMDSSQQVIGPGTTVFGYENKVETSRIEFEMLKTDGTIATNSFTATLAPLLNLPSPQIAFRQWSDFSLLPSFDRLAKYFFFNVYAINSTPEGITFKYFSPTPPRMQ
jgi:hypothetical protein